MRRHCAAGFGAILFALLSYPGFASSTEGTGRSGTHGGSTFDPSFTGTRPFGPAGVISQPQRELSSSRSRDRTEQSLGFLERVVENYSMVAEGNLENRQHLPERRGFDFSSSSQHVDTATLFGADQVFRCGGDSNQRDGGFFSASLQFIQVARDLPLASAENFPHQYLYSQSEPRINSFGTPEFLNQTFAKRDVGRVPGPASHVMREDVAAECIGLLHTECPMVPSAIAAVAPFGFEPGLSSGQPPVEVTPSTDSFRWSFVSAVEMVPAWPMGMRQINAIFERMLWTETTDEYVSSELLERPESSVICFQSFPWTPATFFPGTSPVCRWHSASFIRVNDIRRVEIDFSRAVLRWLRLSPEVQMLDPVEARQRNVFVVGLRGKIDL